MASYKVTGCTNIPSSNLTKNPMQEPQVIRPHSSHRLSVGSTPASNMPSRHSAVRHHSYSVSLGAANSSHRVTRRKSMNASAVTNTAAVAAALQEDVPGVSKRRSFNSKTMGGGRGLEPSKHPNANHDRPNQSEALRTDGNIMGDDDSAVADDFMTAENASIMSKAKARRASEGSHRTKGEGKRSSNDLRCEKCGKGYKHSSCLTKHLWEHTPEWSYTSKLLISKHQQVQLLEAASVLVGMNQDDPVEAESAKVLDSDHSSASPAASGSSDVRDDEDYSSAETTPPPMSEQYGFADVTSPIKRNRYSGNSSSFSRSYQSAPSSSLPPSSAFGQYTQQRRPSTSGSVFASVDDEEAGLAAAVETLCTFGTPRNGPVLLPSDVPPVPPLPAQYMGENVNRLSGHMRPIAEFGIQNPSYQRLSNERDVKMSDEHRDGGDHDNESMSQEPSDEDDEFFGAMEDVSHTHASHVQ